ncbi:MAG: hypothetical protein JWP38_1354 [Herbaspirillum sp.]|jgi:diguanylate cyclase (GGDEF)-like protein|nr:hypothetical protein [Herbaspirillum sp.]
MLREPDIYRQQESAEPAGGLLEAVDAAIAGATSLQHLCDTVCEAIYQAGGLLASTLLAFPPMATWGVFQATSGVSAAALADVRVSTDESHAEGRGLAALAFRSGTTCVSNNYCEDARTQPWHEIAWKIGIKACAALPIKVDGKACAVLVVCSSQPHAFASADIGVLERAAQKLSGALSRLDADSETVAARRDIEQELHESEMRFRALTDLSSDWYWEQDAQFRYTRMESRHQNDDSTQASFLGKRPWESDLEIQAEGGWAEHQAALAAEESFRDVVMYRLLAGQKPYYISVSGAPIFDASGAMVGYRGVSREITEQRIAEQRIRHLATHDSLTDLPNREMFSQLLQSTLVLGQRCNYKFALLFLDLDRFKFINDSLGHGAGDKLLLETALRLKRAMRDNDEIARLGGDEFVVLVREVESIEQVRAIAAGLLDTVGQSLMLEGQECNVTASIGIAMYPAHGEDEQTLMKHADMAMYQAKSGGKNDFRFYSGEIESRFHERLLLESNLRHALANKEMEVYYQPKMSLSDGRINGMEALLRWDNPVLGSIDPVEFIPIAEETGLIVSIGKWVLHTACAQNVEWQRRGFAPLRMAVNLSVRQFGDEHLLRDIAAVLAETGMQPGLLELEITEGTVINDPDRVLILLTAIKKMGVRLAIDDFGTGYSSLGQLRNFPLDTLKVDRSFIADLPDSEGARAIAEATIAMGKAMKLTVVAEGVETVAQADFLRLHHCDDMQGYLFSKALAAEDVTALLQRHAGIP